MSPIVNGLTYDCLSLAARFLAAHQSALERCGTSGSASTSSEAIIVLPEAEACTLPDRTVVPRSVACGFLCCVKSSIFSEISSRVPGIGTLMVFGEPAARAGPIGKAATEARQTTATIVTTRMGLLPRLPRGRG